MEQNQNKTFPAPSAIKRNFERLDSLLDQLASLPRQGIDPELDRSISIMMLERLKNERVLAPGHRVLDVACGNGMVLDWFHKQNSQVTGLCAVEEFSLASRDGLTVRVGDDSFLTNLPTASVDLLWSHQALQRSIMPFYTLTEYNRLLSPGGYAYIDVPAPDTVFRHQTRGGNHSLFGQSMWQELFLRSGFTLIWGIELSAGENKEKNLFWCYLLRVPAEGKDRFSQ